MTRTRTRRRTRTRTRTRTNTTTNTNTNTTASLSTGTRRFVDATGACIGLGERVPGKAERADAKKATSMSVLRCMLPP